MWGVFMFTVLNIVRQTEKRRFFCFRRRKKEKPLLSRVAVRGGAFFYTLTLYADKHGEVDFSAVPEMCLRRVIPVEGTELPDRCPVKLYRPTVFPLTVFLNSSIGLLKRAEDDPRTRTIGIVDPKARLQHGVEHFIPYAKTIRVFTEMPEKYDAVCEMLVKAWGVAPVVSNNPTAMQSCDYVFAPFQNIEGERQGTVRMRQGGNTILSGNTVLLPPEIEMRRPAGTDPLLFAAALYELCNVKEIETLTYDRFVPIKTDAIY